jgi:acyl-CoA thioesterase-1
MRAPPNAGPEYQGEFDAMYPELAREYDAALVPFFMEPLLGKPALIQADRIHPTAAGIDAMVAATVDAVAGALPED